ncbi:NACHT domain-containing protein [Streptomyces prunicolor]|uniref:NACHT domain-containing protein n=1 Tax=Streptomyces prunicolor TaxID=67348 RepID=UPI0037D2AC45
MLLERRDRERELTVELDEESQVELLQRLAYWLIRNGRAEMDRTDALNQLERLLPSMPYVSAQGSAEEILRQLLDRSGLLREPAAGAVDFVHRTFQDYLGARAAVEERDFDALVEHAHLDQWEDVVRMAVAHARPDERARILRGLVGRGDREEGFRRRLHLLAMACLEHAAKLDPGVRDEVERRAGELIPPRNAYEAEKLAELGPIVLELLPGPEDVADDAVAVNVVLTACLIGGDSALPYLVWYREHDNAFVRNQLGFHWNGFDTERYASEIIQHLPSVPDTSIVVRSPEELDTLNRLGGHNYVELAGDFSCPQIATTLNERQLGLALWNNSVVADLNFLRNHQHLRSLCVDACPEISSLAPLVGLPLERLMLGDLAGIPDLSPLRELTQLTYLFLSDEVRGLNVLADLPQLCELGLDLDTPLAKEAWESIASLSELRHLNLSLVDFAGLVSSGVPLQHVETVTVTASRESLDLAAAVTALPAMVRLQVRAADVLDLAPLATHPTLTHITTPPTCRLLNADKLPTTIKLN